MTVITDAEFQALLSRVQRTSEHLQSEGALLVATVRQVTHPLGLSLGPPGTDLMLVGLEEQIAWIKRTVRDLIYMPGTPWTLWNHGNVWAGAPIAGRVSEQINKITLDGTLADDYWQGLAADAYRNALPRQKEAMAALVASAQKIDDVLTRMAVAIGAFWLAALACLLTAEIELAAATAAATTVVGAPAAAASGLSTMVKVGGAIFALLDAFYLWVITYTVPDIKDLRRKLYDGSTFPDGAWPRPSQTITSDAILLDGDGLDWHIKPGI
jgi:hypothetical protein